MRVTNFTLPDGLRFASVALWTRRACIAIVELESDTFVSKRH
jgi:hypothetical protein